MTENKGLIFIGIIVFVLILIANTPNINFPKNLLSALQPSVNFAGLTFEDSGTELSEGCNSGGGQTSISGGDASPLTLSASGSGKSISRQLKADITGIDEIIVVYEGQGTCSPLQAGYGFGITLYSSGDRLSGSKGNSLNTCSISSESKSFQRSMFKFKNNFDGTWSFSEGLALGDLDLIIETKRMVGDRQYLALSVGAGSACGLGGSSSVSFTIYNIIRKANGFAQCKADQYVIGFNGTSPICQDVSFLKLNFEEAFYQSLQDYINSKEAFLEQKSKSLNISIDELRQQLINSNEASKILLQQQISNLTLQLQETKRILQLVENRDPAVIRIFTEKDIQLVQKEPKFSISSFYDSIPTPVKVISIILIIFIIFFRLL